MSTLTLDAQMAFGDPEGLKAWFQDHSAQHQIYTKKLLSTYKTQPPSVDLIDEGSIVDWLKAMEEQDEGVMTDHLLAWLQAHEQLHSVELNAIGAGSTISLASVDFRKPAQFYDWMTYHAEIHALQDTQLT
jgi:cytochrome c1